MSAAIRVEGLGKRYLIGHQARQESYVALRDVIARSVRDFGRTTRDLLRGRPNLVGGTVEEYWALKDVDFEIGQGEVVGVIGRNGAGKSTLLKILSRITEPTRGRVEIRGRVASLLEVGTGFHPELTGRENIYLNGAILGMAHAEIRRKFDEIVAFAEVERFLDTPVKRYSSGMYVRLAFAVAAHLEPEILIVDEVLAVGDAEFQKKCLGKMGEVAGQGRTVLFVSHNMSAVQALCGRTLLLSAGRVAHFADTHESVARYLGEQPARSAQSVVIQEGLKLQRATIRPPSAGFNKPIEMEFAFLAAKTERILECALIISSLDGKRICIIDAREYNIVPCNLAPGVNTLTVSIPRLPMVANRYSIGIYLRTHHTQVELKELGEVEICRPSPDVDFIPVPAEWRGFIESADLKINLRWAVQTHSTAGQAERITI